MNEPVFTPIDPANWPGAQAYWYYTQVAPTSYTVNVSVDVTAARRALKDRGYKFFPAYLYLVTRAMGQVKELRMAVRDGRPGHWDRLTPAYPRFCPENRTTALLWTEYCPNFGQFHARYLEDTARYSPGHGLLTAKGAPPENAYVISCMPWFTFNSFSLHNHGIHDYFFPSFEAGAFVSDGDRITMPLSVTVHHAATDGWHLKEFLELLQSFMDHPEQWL